MYLYCGQHNKNLGMNSYIFTEDGIRAYGIDVSVSSDFDLWDPSLLAYMAEVSEFYSAHKACNLTLIDHRGWKVYPGSKTTCYADEHEEIRTKGADIDVDLTQMILEREKKVEFQHDFVEPILF